MAHAPSSVLVPARQSLLVPFFVAFLAHACGGAAFVGLDMLDWRRTPVLDLDRTIEVEYAVMARGPKRIATVAPRPVGVPEPTPVVPAPPPPPVQSDLVVHQPDAAPAPSGTPQPSRADRDRARREALMHAALQGARPGEYDQQATDPHGTADETLTTGSGGLAADPELAAWKARSEAAFLAGFHPLPTVVSANPGIQSVYRVIIDVQTGDVRRFEPARPSGNASYDAAVERAISMVPRIEPPPDRFREVVGSVLVITFEPPGT